MLTQTNLDEIEEFGKWDFIRLGNSLSVITLASVRKRGSLIEYVSNHNI